MLLSIERDFERLETRVRPTCSEYDGQPLIEEAVLGAAPLTLHPDRGAVAATLLFHRYVSGTLAFDRGCSPHAAEGIRSFLHPISVHVTSIDLKPSRLTIGHRSGVLDNDANGGSRTGGVSLRFPLDGVGAYFSSTEVVVASNFTLFSVSASKDSIGAQYPLLAAAVLLSEDLLLREIVMSRPSGEMTIGDHRSFEAAERLLSTCGIQLNLSEAEHSTNSSQILKERQA